MLVELAIRDFAIIEDVRLRLTPGFNALTGETGAGKSILVGAVGQLLGDRADTDAVRSGAERAIIEGVFEPGARADRIREVLEVYGIDEDPVLIMCREIHAAGRSTARINGRAVPVRALTEIGQLLIDIHGQSDNASLKREAEHVELLDRFGGLLGERAALGERVARLRAVRRELATLRGDAAELARRAELLRYQVDEITKARLRPDEEEALLAERHRLANAERLATLAERAYLALQGDEEQTGAGDLLGAGASALAALAEIDASMREHVEALTAAHETAQDVAHAVRSYRERTAFDASGLEAVEERLAAIGELRRKYGGDVAAVLAHAERAALDLSRLEGAEAETEALDAEAEALLAEIGQLGQGLGTRRREAGNRLTAAVEAQLAVLGMADGRFEVALERTPDPDGAAAHGGRWAFGPGGLERVAFLVSANAGEPPRALARVASGGETARLMLALKNILSAADGIPTLIFDEIDAGIGGRIGRVVGEKLWQLTGRHQVLCVTHLPQVAAWGDSHFHVRKAVVAGRTVTAVDRLDEAARVEELSQMLGGAGEAARANAGQLLAEAGAGKLAAAPEGGGPDGRRDHRAALGAPVLEPSSRRTR